VGDDSEHSRRWKVDDMNTPTITDATRASSPERTEGQIGLQRVLGIAIVLLLVITSAIYNGEEGVLPKIAERSVEPNERTMTISSGMTEIEVLTLLGAPNEKISGVPTVDSLTSGHERVFKPVVRAQDLVTSWKYGEPRYKKMFLAEGASLFDRRSHLTTLKGNDTVSLVFFRSIVFSKNPSTVLKDDSLSWGVFCSKVKGGSITKVVEQGR